ncbi:ATP-binding protein [Tomitella biformata]|uniref:ATP-binding protein n=1 Tax=Tomitella biformata TaxID=630403 RepID=UPI000465BEFE|nr:ATP-binding protein [Tomitella biformata]
METAELATIVKTLRLAGTDTAKVEVKAAVAKVGKSLWPTISAFSNGAGGLVILGLDEKSGFAPAAGFDANRVLEQVAEAARPRGTREGRGPLSPTPAMTVDQVEFEGAMVVVVEVDELPPSDKPCFVTDQGIDRGTYQRLGDGDHRMDTYSVFQLANLTVPSPADRAPVERAVFADLDPQLVARTIERIRVARPRALAGTITDTEVLERIGAVDRDTGLPTLAGLLALGTFPQQFFPQLMVSFASYPGLDKSVVVGDTRMLDRAVLEGAVPDIVDDAVAAVIRNLQVRRVSRGAGAEDVPEIPVDAIREALVNAVSHRDYSAHAIGDQVLVELYPDRLEIHSPGGLWGGRGIENLFDGGSQSRNQVLARLLTDVPFRNRDETVCENAGSGIPRMLGEMTRHGLPAPRFPITASQFVVTLDRFGLLNPETRSWLDALGGGERSREQESALALMHHLDTVSVSELRRQLAVDTTVAQEALDGLVEEGLIQEFAGRYSMAAMPVANVRRGNEFKVVEELTTGGTMSARELAAAIGTTVNAIRPVLRRLMNSGQIEATASVTSRNRAYRMP